MMNYEQESLEAEWALALMLQGPLGDLETVHQGIPRFPRVCAAYEVELARVIYAISPPFFRRGKEVDKYGSMSSSLRGLSG
jgi:hypothetical protein